MSRVEDDAQERRVQERMLLEKQRLEAKNKEKAAGDSRFAKLVFKTGAEKAKSEEARQNATGRDVIERMKGFGSRLQAQKGAEEGAPTQQRSTEMAEGSRLEAAHTHEDDALSGTMAGRKDDARGGDERLQERKESQDNDAAAHLGARQKAREDARAGAGGGGMGGGSNKDQQGDGQASANAQGFRLNPALMAPVAVAQPRTGAMSEKLRALANEIAQKIVQSVRVGTNRAGEAEFQIDLKSSVLNGLQIKVSGKHGKITAVFSGKDAEVLKLIKQNADGLKQALQGRGLLLAELRIEEKK
jgi:hypothetical protein